MVRAVVGTLLEVGRGKRSVEDFRTLVLPAESPGLGAGAPDRDSDSRSRAGESVPGHALFLSGIRY